MSSNCQVNTKINPRVKLVEDYVLIKVVTDHEKEKGGIFIPDTAQQESQIGIVVAMGPGKIDEHGNRIPMDVKIGNKVIVKKYGATKVNSPHYEEDGVKNCIVVRHGDIVIILNSDSV